MIIDISSFLKLPIKLFLTSLAFSNHSSDTSPRYCTSGHGILSTRLLKRRMLYLCITLIRSERSTGFALTILRANYAKEFPNVVHSTHVPIV